MAEARKLLYMEDLVLIVETAEEGDQRQVQQMKSTDGTKKNENNKGKDKAQ